MKYQIDTAAHILELEYMISKLLATGDVDQMMKYMADDVKLLNPGAELLVGNHYEKEALEAARDTEGLEMSFEPMGAEISSSGDMAFAYGEISMKFPDGNQQTEKYVTVWRKNDGNWKVVLQARNSNC
jgi:ketosteroid isomerase-like protein